MRLRRASGSSGSVPRICVRHFSSTTKRKQIGLGEIAVIVRLLLRTHAVCFAFDRIIETSFLGNFSAAFNDSDLALDFVFQRLANEAKRVDVLDFGFGAKFLLSARSHTDIGIAAQRTLFHVDVADAGIKDDLLEASEIFVGFIRRERCPVR